MHRQGCSRLLLKAAAVGVGVQLVLEGRTFTCGAWQMASTTPPITPRTFVAVWDTMFTSFELGRGLRGCGGSSEGRCH